MLAYFYFRCRALPVFPRDLGSAARLLAIVLVTGALAACGSSSSIPHVKRGAFTEAHFGVKASPRLSTAKNPPKGGGRYLVGKPYVVAGDVYEPIENPIGYVASGSASWYGNDFHGRQTANGEIFSANAISCASPVLPLPSYVRVTNLDNGRSIVCRVNDRGPYLHGRVMDMSYRTAAILGYADRGVGNIQVEYVGPAPLSGDDTRMLLASVSAPSGAEAERTRVAIARTTPREGLLDGLTNLFGYAETNESIDGAVAAAMAMANSQPELQAWAARVDEDQRKLQLQLGVFKDAAAAQQVVRSFTMLGAVAEEQVRIPGSDATRLTLVKLKPGVTRQDVMALARELGLNDLSLL
jgi:rare lipoprotein A